MRCRNNRGGQTGAACAARHWLYCARQESHLFCLCVCAHPKTGRCADGGEGATHLQACVGCAQRTSTVGKKSKSKRPKSDRTGFIDGATRGRAAAFWSEKTWRRARAPPRRNFVPSGADYSRTQARSKRNWGGKKRALFLSTPPMRSKGETSPACLIWGGGHSQLDIFEHLKAKQNAPLRGRQLRFAVNLSLPSHLNV